MEVLDLHFTDENIPLYDTVGECRNKEMVCKLARMKCPEFAEKTLDEIRDALNNAFSSDKIIYFLRNYYPATASLGSTYLWIPTGFKDETEHEIYVQFLKGANCWYGAFLGTAEGIIRNEINNAQKGKDKKEMTQNLNAMLSREANKVERKPVPKMEPAPTVTEPVTNKNIIIVSNPSASAKTLVRQTDDDVDMTNVLPEEVGFYKAFLDKLLVKVGWSPALIKSYLYTMVCRENYLLANNRGEEYIIRSDSHQTTKYAMMNTSLLNTLGNPIKLIIKFYSQNELDFSCKGWTVCDSKVTALQHCFTKDDLNKELLPVVYYDKDPNELVFNVELDDFDLENEGRLEHCISRKIERDTTEFSKLTDNQIYTGIVSAIKTAIAISKYDSSYVRPMYNRKFNKINFVIPYHVNGIFEKAPEMGIVVSPKDYGLWQVMTVLDYASVKNNCNCLAPYRDSSF